MSYVILFWHSLSLPYNYLVYIHILNYGQVIYNTFYVSEKWNNLDERDGNPEAPMDDWTSR